MPIKISLSMAIFIMVSSSSSSYADPSVPVHSASWMPYPQYAGPFETCDQMSALPHWSTADGMAKRYPSKQNLELASWCKNAEEQLLSVCQHQDGWASTLQNSDCVFLVGKNGKIQDPFVFPGGNDCTDKFELDAISRVGGFSPPPAYLSNRRLKMYIAYPEIFLQIDFNESEDPDRIRYLESQKANSVAVRTTERPYEKIALDHYNKGVELHQEGHLDQAKLEYEAATRSDDRMAEAWANLGGIYTVQKNYIEAVKAFDNVLRLQPSYTRVSESRSFALKELEKKH
jgi:tetratricopeptide (TPR) repeat protein